MMPKLYSMVKNHEITRQQLLKDIMAGIIVAVIALPLSIALGISSGVSPEKGLITAIIAGFIISFLGGSKVQIGGPTAAFVVIVYGIVEKYGINGLIIASIMAGIMLIIMGVLKLGVLIKYVPRTITVGFTAGIAVTLFVTQLKDLFGLSIDKVPAEFLPKIGSYINNIGSLNVYSLLIGLICILIMVFWGKINKSIPGSIVALIFATAVVLIFKLPVETIGSRFSQLSSTIPVPVMPEFTLDSVKELIKPAFTIAVLAAIESLLSAVVADGMIDDNHDSNMELIAQGIGNIAAAIFGGIPATGAIARTAANIKNGGRSPIAGIVHAIVLLLVLLLLMPLAKLIPMTALASVLIVVAFNMGEWKVFARMMKAPKSDMIVLVLTFILTVIFDLVIAIEAGMVLAMFLWIRRLADTTEIKILDKGSHVHSDRIMTCEVNGPFFFGVVQEFINKITDIDSKIDVVILDMRHVQALDVSAISAIERLHGYCEKNNIKLIVINLQKQPLKALTRIEFIEKLDKRAVFESRAEGLKAASEYIEGNCI